MRCGARCRHCAAISTAIQARISPKKWPMWPRQFFRPRRWERAMARHHGTWENSLAEMLHVTSEETVRAKSIDWVARSLSAEGLPNDDQLAERLVGAAEHFNVPIELLITWIHD